MRGRQPRDDVPRSSQVAPMSLVRGKAESVFCSNAPTGLSSTIDSGIEEGLRMKDKREQATEVDAILSEGIPASDEGNVQVVLMNEDVETSQIETAPREWVNYSSPRLEAGQDITDRPEGFESLQDAVEGRGLLVTVKKTDLQQYEEQASKLDAIQRENKDISNAYETLKREYELQKRQNTVLRQSNNSLKAMLEKRTLELHGVERFLTTADTFSGSEVVSTLRKLNETVQQGVAYMAEWMTRNLAFGTQRTDQLDRQPNEQKRMPEFLGVEFARLLGTAKHVDNPILLEMALQAYLLDELHSLASQRIATQGNRSYNSFIDGIYHRMRKEEGQAVSGNWRALTHIYAVSTETEGTELKRVVGSTIIKGISDILTAAGCTNSKSDIASALASKFAEKIRNFVSLAGRVSMIIRAGVISEDFEVLLVSPGSRFDRSVMEDWDEETTDVAMDGFHEQTVLCAMELGLMKRTRIVSAMEKESFSESVMLRPKVAIVSILNTIRNL